MHDIVGVVTEVGSKVQKFKVSDKVGVGCLVGSCHSCDNCANDLENYCPKNVFTYNSIYYDGNPTYGGYSNTMVANEHFVIRIPDNLPLDACAPLLCAGITTYSLLRHFGPDKLGMHVGVVGLGGLGHTAVKFAKAFGVKVTVIIGTMNGIIDPLLPLIGLLKSQGKLILVSAPEKPLELLVFPLLMDHQLVPCYSNVETRHGASPSVIIICGGFAGMAAAWAFHDASFQHGGTCIEKDSCK
ncbi:unnamed protein product [Camellia sinensis]